MKMAKINKQDTKHGKMDLPVFPQKFKPRKKKFGEGGQVKKPDPKSDDLTPKSNLPKRQYEGVSKPAPKRPDPKMIDDAVKRGAIRESAYAAGGKVRGGGCATKGMKYRMR